MSLNYYQIFNDSADTKVFGYRSGSTDPGTSFTITIKGNSSSIIESYTEPYNIPTGTSEADFLSDSFYPSSPGYAWLWNDGNKVKYIKINHTSANGATLEPYINKTNIISFQLLGALDAQRNYIYGSTSSLEVEDYGLNNSIRKPQNYNLLVVDQDDPITSIAVDSLNQNYTNFNFFASGSYLWYATASGRSDEPISSSDYTQSIAQGYFPANIEDFGSEQFIRGWANANYYIGDNLISTTGFETDFLNQFNTGSTERDYDDQIPYSPSLLPWFINAPSSSFLIESESFNNYTTQNRIVQIGPRFMYTTPKAVYEDAVYETGEYEGTGQTGKLVYYYKEDTNEILIQDAENILNDPKSNVIHYNDKKNVKLIGLNNAQTYTTEEGHQIPIKSENELWLYRGYQNPGSGDVDAWNYNIYLHRPYKIYIVTTTGSNSLSSHFEKVYVSFSSSLASERPLDGAYVFNINLSENVELTASVTLTGSRPYPVAGYDTASYDNYDEYDQTPNPEPTAVTWETASLRLYKGSVTNVGNIYASETINISDINIDNKITLNTSLTASVTNAGDTFRLALFVDTASQSTTVNSALLAIEYDMQISASTPAGSDLVPTFIDNILNVPYDCNPIVGNAIDPRNSSILMDVDYTSQISGALHPINFDQIIAKTATKATVPDSNYTYAPHISSRYKGKQIEAHKYNISSPTDIMPIGKLSTVDYKNAYIGYFTKVIDFYPTLNNKTAYYIKYLISDQGDLLDPSLSQTSYYNLLNTYNTNNERIGQENTSLSTKVSGIALNPGESNELLKLKSFSDVWKVGYYPAPILYSQTSSVDYIGDANSGIPLTGSEFIQTLQDYSDYAFTLDGAVANSGSNRVADGDRTITDIYPLTGSFTYLGQFFTQSAFTGSSEKYIHFKNDEYGKPPNSTGGQLSDNYQCELDYTFYTTGMPWRGSNSKKIYQRDFGEISFCLQRSSDPAFTNPLDLTISVESVTLDWIGNLGTDFNDPIIRNVPTLSEPLSGIWDYPKNNSPFKILFHSNITDAVVNTGIDYHYAKSMPGINNNSEEGNSKWRWRVVLKLDTQQYQIRQGDYLRWKVEGVIDHITQHDRNYGGRKRGFFPQVPNSDTEARKAIVRTRVYGKNTSVANLGNIATPDYWIFSGSSFDTLICSSSMLNQTYDQNYYQGDLIYNGSINGSQPTSSAEFGKNTDFPYNVEPSFVSMGAITNQWKLQEGDEIRFENDENYSRRITHIFPPGIKDIKINDQPALVIKLENPLPGSVSLNHFLIRRYEEAKNIVIVDQQKPYGVPVLPSTSAGILKPEFVVDKLDRAPEKIFNELIDKKILE